jgi:glycosyltransferase involved in cell wall biosynthesis
MNINFFTATFPYLDVEPFIENEIPVTSKKVNSITIFPYLPGSDPNHREIPSNCAIIQRDEAQIKLSGREYLTLINLITTEFYLTPKKYYFLKNIRKWISLGRKALVTARFLSALPQINTQNICYSYWMNDWALALTVLKMQKKISVFVFRCGGFDIWDERSDGGYLPFRSLIYKYANGIYPNSVMAEKYLRQKDIFPDKIKCMYWGTRDYGLSPFTTDAKFTIVSCSHVIPLKRVNLIIEILSHLNFGVRWVHFGGGTDLEKIKAQAEPLKSRHQVEFMGQIENQEVLEFYKKNVVHLFITTSSTEGLPVSLQEAVSFGIPCLATDVGGIREVVNPETGILINKDFVPSAVADEIEKFRSSERNSVQFRENIRKYWQGKFAANTNYADFITELISLQAPVQE